MRTLIISLLFCLPALAQSYYGSNGAYQGRAVKGPGGTTSYYGANGAYLGRSQTGHGGTTSYYGANGAYQGRS
ncbi:MAG: hypothetical protein Q4F38_09185, partial [Akkermansia sp.]|nr:hypothetical protein [Akkermansia sp.]